MPNKATVTYKKNSKRLDPCLPKAAEAMIRLCLRDLDSSLGAVHIEVHVKKTYYHRKVRGLRGQMWLLYQGRRQIYLFPWNCGSLREFCETIAHEFGHFKHYIECPESVRSYNHKTATVNKGWSKRQKEQYAENYSDVMLRLLEAVYPGCFSDPDDNQLYQQIRYHTLWQRGRLMSNTKP